MTVLVLTRGLPASGKTTWAKAWVDEESAHRARLNRDDLRRQMFGKPFLDYAGEQAVTHAQQSAAKALLRSGRDVVVDDTNLRAKYVRAWVDLAAETGSNVRIREFTDVAVDECVRRDAERDQPVGEQVIRDMHRRYFPLSPVDTGPLKVALYDPDSSLPAAWIVDIDGTLATMCDRSPYDETRVLEDKPNGPVVELVRGLYDASRYIVLLSGRTEACRQDTRIWLKRHEIPFDALFMRSIGDQRKDAIVKRELFEQHVAPKWAVRGVIDDRRQVVDMWRSLGLLCAQVAPGEF